MAQIKNFLKYLKPVSLGTHHGGRWSFRLMEQAGGITATGDTVEYLKHRSILCLTCYLGSKCCGQSQCWEVAHGTFSKHKTKLLSISWQVWWKASGLPGEWWSISNTQPSIPPGWHRTASSLRQPRTWSTIFGLPSRVLLLEELGFNCFNCVNCFNQTSSCRSATRNSSGLIWTTPLGRVQTAHAADKGLIPSTLRTRQASFLCHGCPGCSETFLTCASQGSVTLESQRRTTPRSRDWNPMATYFGTTSIDHFLQLLWSCRLPDHLVSLAYVGQRPWVELQPWRRAPGQENSHASVDSRPTDNPSCSLWPAFLLPPRWLYPDVATLHKTKPAALQQTSFWL